MTVTPARDQVRQRVLGQASAPPACRRWTSGRPRAGRPARPARRMQLGVLRGRDAVADPLGPEHVEGVPDRLRTGGLPRVRHAVQPGRAGRGEVRLELRPRHPDLGTAQAEAHQRVGRRRSANVQGRVGGRHARSRRGCRSIHRSDHAEARPRAAIRASSMASQNASAGMPRVHRRVRRARSARRTAPAGAARSRMTSSVSMRTSSASRTRSTTLRYTSMKWREVGEREVVGEQVRVGRHRCDARCRAASRATVSGDADPTWWTCSSALGRPATASAVSTPVNLPTGRLGILRGSQGISGDADALDHDRAERGVELVGLGDAARGEHVHRLRHRGRVDRADRVGRWPRRAHAELEGPAAWRWKPGPGRG